MGKKRYIILNKKWKEILYAASGFGPNLLMILMGAFYSDAVNPSALNGSVLQTITGTCLVTPLVFAILMAIAKAFDGIVDIPLAAFSDNLKTKWGKRRLPIAISFLPMVISYACLWIPIGGVDNQVLNTIWMIGMAFIFFTTYTLCLIVFYGSLSTVCYDDAQRLRVSSFKSFFDTITYCIVYALVPVLLSAFQIHIDTLVFILMPIMLTMLIPVFIIKEGNKFEQKAIAEGYDIKPLAEEPKVGILDSIKLTFTNRPFIRWCIVNACTYFGLQMFLVSMNALICGGMGLSEGQMAILNTCAFAPVPVMLYLFNKMKSKKGIRFTYQSCLICFAICIFSFVFGNEIILGEGNTSLKIIIGCVGSVIGSWAIGSFFMMPYLIPAQVSSVEEKLTGKNHSAMYFAGQAIFTSISGALATGVYEFIKNYFITKDFKIVYAVSNDLSMTAREIAASKLGISISEVFNLGTLIVPFVVSIFCIFGVILAFKMPKNYSPSEVSKLMNLEKEYEANKDLFPEEDNRKVKDESLIVNCTLWILSGTLFGIIWKYCMIKDVNKISDKKINLLHWIISVIIFPYSAIVYFKLAKSINLKCNELQIKTKNYSIICAIFGFLGLSIIPLTLLQKQLNKIANYE